MMSFKSIYEKNKQDSIDNNHGAIIYNTMVDILFKPATWSCWVIKTFKWTFPLSIALWATITTIAFMMVMVYDIVYNGYKMFNEVRQIDKDKFGGSGRIFDRELYDIVKSKTTPAVAATINTCSTLKSKTTLKKCPTCKGKGSRDGLTSMGPVLCADCNGTGEIRTQETEYD